MRRCTLFYSNLFSAYLHLEDPLQGSRPCPARLAVELREKRQTIGMSFREAVQPEVSGAGGAPTDHAVHVGSYGCRVCRASHCFCVRLAAVSGSLWHRRNHATGVC